MSPRDLAFVGYPFLPIGMGEHIRSAVRAVRAVGRDLRLVDVADHPAPEDPDLARELGGLARGGLGEINVFCVNGDEAARVIERFDRGSFERAYNIIYPAWELARYPEAWARVLARFDEVWAPSAFVREAIAAAVPRPVVQIPLPVEVRLPRVFGRRHFDVPEDAFVVLFSFDFASFAERKNPAAMLEAFERLAARRPDADLHCVIKARGGGPVGGAQRDLAARVAALGDRAQILTGDLTDTETKNLLRVCDVFVSLHRSEGFGRGMAEAMALGRPAVATGYSGNLEFMTPETSRLVDYRLIPVAPGAYPQGDGQVWADADPAHAADILEALLDDPAGARALGRRARTHMAAHFSYRAVGLRYLERLDAA